MSNKTQRKGHRSKQFGHLGVYFLSTGPDPKGAMPGERIIIVIYNKDNEVIRRLEQVKGGFQDEGWTDYFESPRCKPSIREYHIIDIDKEGNQEILATHTQPSDAGTWLKPNFPKWAQQHGIQEST